MTSAVLIANRALEQVGVDPISSLDDATKPARLCKRLFPQLRDATLRDHEWSFATTRATLAAAAAMVGAPAGPTIFPLPTDCLRLLSLLDGWQSGYGPHWCSRTPYRLESQGIVTCAPAPLTVRYIQQVVDVARFDALFTEALVTRLAMNLAVPLADDKALMQALAQTFRDALREARGVSVSEGRARQRDDFDVLEARR